MNQFELLERVVALIGKPPPEGAPTSPAFSKIANLATAACALAELGHWEMAIKTFRQAGDLAGPAVGPAWHTLAEELAGRDGPRPADHTCSS